MKNKLIIIVVFVLFSEGCATYSQRLGCGVKPILRPGITPILRRALETSVECRQPEVAKLNPKDLADFRYGCFCGQNYPDINRNQNETNEELIARYYEIKPIDDVDRVCRDHDVCWIMNGEGNADCDHELIHQLTKIEENIPEGNGVGWRCGILIDSIKMAFESLFFKIKYENRGRKVRQTVADLLDSPIKTMFTFSLEVVSVPLDAAVLLDDSTIYNFPSAGERCYEQ